jgi:hypothetical protein
MSITLNDIIQFCESRTEFVEKYSMGVFLTKLGKRLCDEAKDDVVTHFELTGENYVDSTVGRLEYTVANNSGFDDDELRRLEQQEKGLKQRIKNRKEQLKAEGKAFVASTTPRFKLL